MSVAWGLGGETGATYESDEEHMSSEDERGGVVEDETVASDVRSDEGGVRGDEARFDDRPVWLPFGDDDPDIRAAQGGAYSGGGAGAYSGGAAACQVTIHMLLNVPREPIDEQIERVAGRAPFADAIPWRKQKVGLYFYGAQRVEIRAVGGQLRVKSRRVDDEPLSAFLERASKIEKARLRGVQAFHVMQQMESQALNK